MAAIKPLIATINAVAAVNVVVSKCKGHVLPTPNLSEDAKLVLVPARQDQPTVLGSRPGVRKRRLASLAGFIAHTRPLYIS